MCAAWWKGEYRHNTFECSKCITSLWIHHPLNERQWCCWIVLKINWKEREYGKCVVTLIYENSNKNVSLNAELMLCKSNAPTKNKTKTKQKREKNVDRNARANKTNLINKNHMDKISNRQIENPNFGVCTAK